MTVKFTRTDAGNEANNEELLFEFLDHELPESVKHKWRSAIKVNKFAGSLQTVQMTGNYYEPITWSGEFFGQYINSQGQYITAKQRADQLHRLQFSLVKFFFEGIKQIVLISEFEFDIFNYQEVKYTITLQPHDITNEIEVGEAGQVILRSYNALNDPANNTNKGKGKDLDPDKIKIIENKQRILSDDTQTRALINRTDPELKLMQNNLEVWSKNKSLSKEYTQFEKSKNIAEQTGKRSDWNQAATDYLNLENAAARQDEVLNNPAKKTEPLPNDVKKGESINATKVFPRQ